MTSECETHIKHQGPQGNINAYHKKSLLCDCFGLQFGQLKKCDTCELGFACEYTRARFSAKEEVLAWVEELRKALKEVSR